MNRPTLAYIAISLNPGGTERLVVDMAKAFSNEYHVQVFTLDDQGTWASELEAAGIAVTSVKRRPGVDLSVVVRLARHLRAIDADIVHAHQCSPWFYAALARLLYWRARLVLQEHGRFWPEPDKPLRRLVNRLIIIPLTHRFVAVSQDIAERLTRYEGVPARRIELIHNGIRPTIRLPDSARERLRALLCIEPQDFVVGTVGRLEAIKNLPMLIDAIRDACRENPRLRGLIIGDGPERSMIRALIESAGLSARVTLAGHRDDARQLIQCMDLFTLTSLSEGTSVALLEAMAAGVPVVVTAVGGNPDIVTDGKEGWLVGSGDSRSLAAVIGYAASHPQDRSRRASCAQQRYEANFSEERMLNAYRAVYSTVVSS